MFSNSEASGIFRGRELDHGQRFPPQTALRSPSRSPPSAPGHGGPSPPALMDSSCVGHVHKAVPLPAWLTPRRGARRSKAGGQSRVREPPVKSRVHPAWARRLGTVSSPPEASPWLVSLVRNANAVTFKYASAGGEMLTFLHLPVAVRGARSKLLLSSTPI